MTKLGREQNTLVVFRQSAKWLLVVTLTLSLGCHWAILQSAAWVGMVVKYSEEGSFKEALDKTFDGNHPCKLCNIVKEGKQAEKKSEAQIDLKKLDFFTTSDAVFYFIKVPNTVTFSHFSFLSRFDSPPTPPPLFA